MADVILFDSSPVLAVTDASVLANRVDGVILVSQAKRTRRGAAKQAIERLNQVGANIIGGVLNQAPNGKGSYYASAYHIHSGYGLATQLEKSRQRHWWQRLSVFK